MGVSVDVQLSAHRDTVIQRQPHHMDGRAVSCTRSIGLTLKGGTGMRQDEDILSDLRILCAEIDACALLVITQRKAAVN